MAEDSKTYTQAEVDELVAAQVSGLKTNRDEVLKEAKAAKAALAKYDGVDPEEFKRLKDAASEAEQKRAAAAGDFESLKRQLVEKHMQEITSHATRETKLQTALERRLVQAELTAAIAKHRGDAELLMPIASRFVKVRETDNDDGYAAFVVDEKGNERVADGKGTPMTFDDLVTQVLLPKYPRAFDGTGSSGGGASKSSGSAGGMRVVAADDPKAFLASLEGIANGTIEVR